VTNAVTGTQFNLPTGASSHSIDRAQLAIQTGSIVILIALATHQPWDEHPQSLLSESIALVIAHVGADRLNTVVNGTDTGAQPDRVRCRGSQFWVENDETGPTQRFLEAMFPHGLVFGAAGKVGIFSCGQRRWDTDDGDYGWFDVRPFIGPFREGSKVVGGGDIIGKSLAISFVSKFLKKKRVNLNLRKKQS
jgi:hypothetical protein